MDFHEVCGIRADCGDELIKFRTDGVYGLAYMLVADNNNVTYILCTVLSAFSAVYVTDVFLQPRGHCRLRYLEPLVL